MSAAAPATNEYPKGDWEPGDRWRCAACGHGWNAIDETECPRDECPLCGTDGQGNEYVAPESGPLQQAGESKA